MKIIGTLGFLAVLTLGIHSRASAQDKVAPTQQAENCSVNVSGTNNTVSLTCNKSDENMVRQIAAILNLGHADSARLKQISDTLDEMKQRLLMSDKITVEVARNGIANAAPNFGTQTVNNLAPPPNYLVNEEIINPASDSQEKRMKIHISPDRPVHGAVIGIIFSSPIEQLVANDMAFSPVSAIWSVRYGQLLDGNGQMIPNSLGFTMDAPATFMPSDQLIVTIKSTTEVHVKQVFAVVQ